jgi:hypothetical protein
MVMQSKTRALVTAMILPCVLLASGCGGRARIQPIFPDAADVEASQERKPVPGVEIVSDPVARAFYDAQVESWGDRVSAAAVRICHAMNDMGGKFACAKPAAKPMERAAPR